MLNGAKQNPVQTFIDDPGDRALPIAPERLLWPRRSSLLVVPITRYLPADIAQHGQRPACAKDVIFSDAGEQFGIDFFSPRFLRCSRRTATLRETDRQLAPVVFVRSALQVAARHQRIDKLSRRLLRNAAAP